MTNDAHAVQTGFPDGAEALYFQDQGVAALTPIDRIFAAADVNQVIAAHGGDGVAAQLAVDVIDAHVTGDSVIAQPAPKLIARGAQRVAGDIDGVVKERAQHSAVQSLYRVFKFDGALVYQQTIGIDIARQVIGFVEHQVISQRLDVFGEAGCIHGHSSGGRGQAACIDGPHRAGGHRARRIAHLGVNQAVSGSLFGRIHRSRQKHRDGQHVSVARPTVNGGFKRSARRHWIDRGTATQQGLVIDHGVISVGAPGAGDDAVVNVGS